MTKLNSLFIFLTSGTGKLKGFLNDNSNVDQHFITDKPTGGLNLSPTINFFKNFHIIFQIIDWVSIIMIIIGLIVLSTSNLGSNGKWKKAGVRIIAVGFIWILFYHVLVLMAISYGNFGDMKLLIFIMMVLGQILMYVASSTMFVIGSHDLEMYEMAETPASERKKIQAYNQMLVVLISGAAAYFLAGMIG